ncbi:MAG: hypothetical protein HYZ28_18275 [Myxococcales bacterium]|nr:hypothetical protein [Myxococcales bacterium]
MCPLCLALALSVSACRCGAPPASSDAGADSGDPFGDHEDGGLGGAGACDGGLRGEGTAMASSLDSPRRIATDGTHVYLSVSGPAALALGKLQRVATAGGLLETLAEGFSSPDAIAVDADSVYLVDGDGLWRISKQSGAKTLLDPAPTNHLFGDTDLALSGAEVALATGFDSLLRVKRDGSARAVLYLGPPGSAVRAVLAEAGTVLFLVSESPESGLYEVKLDGSAPAARLRDISGGRSLHATATHFFWSEGASGQGRVLAAPRTGGEPVELAAGLEGPSRLLGVGRFLYFKNATPTGASERFFLRASLCEPGLVVPVGPQGAGPGDLAFDGATLFFSSADTAPLGYLSRLP